jgi:hypothetical protein
MFSSPGVFQELSPFSAGTTFKGANGIKRRQNTSRPIEEQTASLGAVTGSHYHLMTLPATRAKKMLLLQLVTSYAKFGM